MCWIRILIDFQKMKCIFIWPLSEIQEINKGWKVKSLELPSERSHQHPSWFLQSGRLLLWLLEYAKKLGLILIDWSKVQFTWNTAICQGSLDQNTSVAIGIGWNETQRILRILNPRTFVLKYGFEWLGKPGVPINAKPR